MKKLSKIETNATVDKKDIQKPALDCHEKAEEKQLGVERGSGETNTEKFTLKGIGKDTATNVATNSSNFLKIYATPDGYSVGDGAANGGLFLRSFCRVLKDTNFVSKHYLNDLILKIRKYTKREVEFT